MLDANGNRILWGWITETRSDADLIAAGWAGAMSLPRTLSLDSENALQTNAAPICEQLRAAHASITSETTPTAQQKMLAALRIRNLAAELQLSFRPKRDECSIHLQSESGENFATLSFTNKSSVRELHVNAVTAPLPGVAGSPVQLRAFLDGSVLELFVNGTTSLTARIYTIPSGPLRIKIEGEAELTKLDLWQMTPISKDRLTGSLCS
jgi:beta-fructofuranosidase